LRPALFARTNYRRLLLWSAPLVWLGCGGGGTDIVLPSLTVTTSTSGVELDPDGYSVVVDAQPPEPIGLNASLTVDRLADGPHTVALAGLASNCVQQGENPRTVTAQTGSTASLTFTITCSASSGTIEITTTTSGAGTDPDGFALTLDGADRGPIGVTATMSLTAVTPGAHNIGLTGLAGNCQVVGDNPRAATVTAGQTTQISFSVTCAAPPSTSGSLQITTTSSGSPADPDGYTVSVDGAAGQVIGTNASLTLAGLAVGSHTVLLAGTASNCRVSGPNPARASVTQGQLVPVSFTVVCSANTGGLRVTISGLPSGTAAAVTVTGPSGFSRAVTATVGLTDLTPGSYTVTASAVTAGGTTYTPTVDPPTVQIAAGGNPSVSVTYRGAAGTTLNLRIAGLYLTQSTQTLAGAVPLVRDRAAFLRVFVVANEATTARPVVRVRLFQGSAVTSTITIQPPAAPPTETLEGNLGRSWNARIDASLIRPGLSIMADVDPGNAVVETNENDNSFPTAGNPKAIGVETSPIARIRFVPIRQGTGPAGNVSNSNKDQLVELAQRIYPLNTVETDVREAYTTTTVLDDDADAWGQVLGEINVLRITDPDGAGHTYFGIAKLDYRFGLVGLTFLGDPTSMGTDDPSIVKRIVAHELGHTWNQLHTPCGNPPPSTVDPGYPYGNGIGVYGYDVTASSLKPPSSPDIMGYCSDPWISDYIYRRVLEFRKANPLSSQANGTIAQPTLLVWGRIVNGQPILEPAFEIVTRPSLPTRPGPYAVEGVATDGSPVFSLSFDAKEIADDPGRSRHFAFAVPLNPAQLARLGSLRLMAPGGRVAARAQPTVQLRPGGQPESFMARRDAAGVTFSWNPLARPMVMIRDPDTGKVLSLARGGSVQLQTTKGTLALEASDGVRSHRVRLAIKR
jgi:hypothetical protein